MTARKNTARKVAETVVLAATEAVQTEATETANEAKEAVTTPAIVYPTTEEMVKLGLDTKSSRIRHLFAMGMSKGDIAKQETNGLYQHVYNVLQKELKKGPRDSAAKAAAEAAKPAEPVTEAVVTTTESTEVPITNVEELVTEA